MQASALQAQAFLMLKGLKLNHNSSTSSNKLCLSGARTQGPKLQQLPVRGTQTLWQITNMLQLNQSGLTVEVLTLILLCPWLALHRQQLQQPGSRWWCRGQRAACLPCCYLWRQLLHQQGPCTTEHACMQINEFKILS
jgi:hypothetical protein